MKLFEKVRLALGQDETLLVTMKDLPNCKGNDEEYLAQLGLSRNDLKRLERKGLAIRGWTPNGSLLPIYGHEKNLVGYRPREWSRRGQRGFLSGSRVRWILIDMGGSNGSETIMADSEGSNSSVGENTT